MLGVVLSPEFIRAFFVEATDPGVALADCTREPHGAEEEHEATAERRPGAVDVLEVWT